MRYALSFIISIVMILTWTPVYAGAAAYKPKSVVVIGDSLSIPVSKQLEKYFKIDRKIAFKRLGKVSSGLARPDSFDWHWNLKQLSAFHKPDTVFVMLGTNDTKRMKTIDDQVLTFGGYEWDDEYSHRLQRLVDTVRKYNPASNVYFIGAPIVGHKVLNKQIRHINTVIKGVCTINPGVYYVDTYDTLSDENGRYIKSMRSSTGEAITLRADDGVHITKHAAALLAERCIAVLNRTPSTPEYLANATFKNKSSQSAPKVKKTAKAPKKSKAQPAPAPQQTAKKTTPNKPKAASRSKVTAKKVHTAKKNARTAYSIQESSWPSRDKAQQRANQLKHSGLAVQVVSADLGAKGVWHRVMIGKFATLQAAQKNKKSLDERLKLRNTLILKSS